MPLEDPCWGPQALSLSVSRGWPLILNYSWHWQILDTWSLSLSLPLCPSSLPLFLSLYPSIPPLSYSTFSILSSSSLSPLSPLLSPSSHFLTLPPSLKRLFHALDQPLQLAASGHVGRREDRGCHPPLRGGGGSGRRRGSAALR